MSFPVFLYLLRSSSIKYPVCYILVSSFLDPRVNRDTYIVKQLYKINENVYFIGILFLLHTTVGELQYSSLSSTPERYFEFGLHLIR